MLHVDGFLIGGKYTHNFTFEQFQQTETRAVKLARELKNTIFVLTDKNCKHLFYIGVADNGKMQRLLKTGVKHKLDVFGAVTYIKE